MAEPLVQLNDSWRGSGDPPQWTIERREGKPREKNDGWQACKFIRKRDHLLRRIGELCGRVDPKALETIRSWPPGYVQWKCREMKARAGPNSRGDSAISVKVAA